MFYMNNIQHDLLKILLVLTNYYSLLHTMKE